MRYLFLVADGSDCSPDVIALVKQVAYEICFGIHSRADKSFSHQERHDVSNKLLESAKCTCGSLKHSDSDIVPCNLPHARRPLLYWE